MFAKLSNIVPKQRIKSSSFGMKSNQLNGLFWNATKTSEFLVYVGIIGFMVTLSIVILFIK